MCHRFLSAESLALEYDAARHPRAYAAQMRGTTDWRLSGDWRNWGDWRLVGDWTPVALVAVLSQLGIGLEEPWEGSNATLALTGLLLALPLAVRRIYPLLVCACIAGALIVQVTAGVSLHFGSFVAVLIAAYAVGQHARTTMHAVAGAAALLAGSLAASLPGLWTRPEEAIFPTFYISAATALGHVVRRLSRQSAELQRLNEALAAEKEASIQLAVASERMRLARDLHDVVAHTLMVMVVQAEAGEDSLTRDPSATRRALERIQQAGRSGLDDLRSMVRVLRTEEPSPEPDLTDLPTLVAVLAEGGLHVALATSGDLARVTHETGLQLFRVIQEALTNVVKHSAATSAAVSVTIDDVIEIRITDPGPALGGPHDAGHGILGMAERIEALGGHVSAGPVATGGFGVSVRLQPVPAAPLSEPTR